MEINKTTDVYTITYIVTENIFIKHFQVNPDFRKYGFGTNIIKNLLEEYNMPIMLECWPTLWPFYEKIGFIRVGQTYDGYYEVELKIKKNGK